MSLTKNEVTWTPAAFFFGKIFSFVFMLFVVAVSQTLTSTGPRPSKATKKNKGAAPKTSKTTKVKSYHRTDEQISLQLETYRSVQPNSGNKFL